MRVTCLVPGSECCGVGNAGLEGGIHCRVRVCLRWSEVDLVIGEAGGEAGSEDSYGQVLLMEVQEYRWMFWCCFCFGGEAV